MIESLPRAEKIAAYRRLARTPEELDRLFAHWTLWQARDEQLPPPDWIEGAARANGPECAEDKDKIVWLLLAGRGFGKTRTGAETVKAEILAGRAARIALVAPTAADVRNVMVEGESGILGTAAPDFRPLYEPSKAKLTWPDGSIALCYSADEPERLRGPQHDFAWCDELAAWRYTAAWDMLMLGLRLGARPRAVVTTTPKPMRLIRDLAASPTTVLTRGSTFDNKENLAPAFLSVIVQTYEGTRLGRQELYAELLEQADGALWTRAMLDAARIDIAHLPEMKRIVVAIDPAVTAGEKSDETGMIVAGLGSDGLVYIVADASGRFSPGEWARRAVALYDTHSADRIIGEVNNGGDLIETTLRTVRGGIAYKAVTATKGKRIRAEPVAALYEQSRVKHAPGLGLLEDQMCNWEPGGADASPDRLDALVWAVTELMFTDRSTGLLDYYGSLTPREAP